MTALTAQGATPSMITAAFTAVGSALNTTAAQVNQKLTALAALCDNPVAYAASAPAIINDVEGLVAGKYPGVVPLLETLRNPTSALQVAQTIQQIELQV